MAKLANFFEIFESRFSEKYFFVKLRKKSCFIAKSTLNPKKLRNKNILDFSFLSSKKSQSIINQ